MRQLLLDVPYFPIFLTMALFWLARKVCALRPHPLLHPVLVAVALIFLVLWGTGYDVAQYQLLCRPLTDLLTPATIALGLGIYRQREELLRHWRAILAAVALGVAGNVLSILALAKIFGLDLQLYATLLPKSNTTAIGVAVSETFGGIPSITGALIVLTGVWGSIAAVPLLNLLRIREPVAKGVAIGTAAHAIGTTKALELGPTEGAISSLAIPVCGLVTVLSMPLALWLF